MDVTPASTAPYTTRVVVYRPIDAKKFDGTVAVEWLNVTGGVDAAAAWLTGHAEMVRAGMAYVGVDAQAGGIYGVPGSVATADGAGGIKQTDPTRYAALVHPGDSYSYSIFEQAGEAVHASAAKLLGGLTPKRVLAIGESQSAFYLTTYLDAIQPLSVGVYDGYLVYSRGSDGSDLSQSPQATISTPNPTYIRTDLHVPVMLFETEADLLTLGYVHARAAPHRVHQGVGDGGHRARRHLRAALLAFGQSERGGRRRGLRVDAEPTQGPDPGHRRLCRTDQRGVSHLRTPGGRCGARELGAHRQSAATVAAPGGEREQDRLRAERRRQCDRWDPHAAGRRTGRQAVGHRATGEYAGEPTRPGDHVAQLGGGRRGPVQHLRDDRSAERVADWRSCTRPTPTS